MDAKGFLIGIAAQSASAWHALGGSAFPGEATLETANTLYLFKDGVFVSRARKPEATHESPPALTDMRLIGFVADEGGFCSLSPRWRRHAHAALWKPGAFDERAVLLTSPALSFRIDRPDPARIPSPLESGIVVKLAPSTPHITPPAPPSATRLHPMIPKPAAR